MGYLDNTGLSRFWTKIKSLFGSSLALSGSTLSLKAKDNTVLSTVTLPSGGGGGSVSWDDVNDKPTFAAVATSGSYTDLTNQPSIPSEVTASTVSGWGFTKNTGTYSKPSGGIPKSDLASAVQTSLANADSAVQAGHFVKESFTGATKSIAASSYGYQTVNISKSGYTPIAVTSISTGAQTCPMYEFTLNAASVTVRVRNVTNAARDITPVVAVLFVKTTA